jgi:hypothetical protein
MTRFEVEANVYSLSFWGTNGFSFKGVRFVPFETHKEIEESIKEEEEHHPTGTVSVEVTADNCEKAVEEALSLLTDYSTLLTFVEGHDVFFRDFTCFEVENGVKVKKSTVVHSMRFGKAVGSRIVNLWSVAQFMEAALPLIQDKSYVEKTGIKLAIFWFNEAQNYNLVEIEFPALWISLEILANSYAKSNPKAFLLSEGEWSQLMTKFGEVLENLKIDSKDVQQRLYGALGFAKQGSMEDKINYLLQGYAFTQYSPEVEYFNEMRNTVLHGRPLASINFDPFETTRKLERLLVKLILSVLNFYDEKLVHPVFLKDDLLAMT